MMSPAEDEAFMRLALALAAGAGELGEVPVGALVERGGEVIGRGANSRERSGDPTAHAEMVALREAAAVSGTWHLDGATVYVTMEPCPMCAGALVAARVTRLVFGAADTKAGACGSLYNLCADPRLNHEVAVTRGVLAGEAADLAGTFFAGKRPKAQRRNGPTRDAAVADSPRAGTPVSLQMDRVTE